MLVLALGQLLFETMLQSAMPVLALGQLLFGTMLQTEVAPVSWISQGNVKGLCWLKPVDGKKTISALVSAIT
jgi:hypothetical protein